MEIPTVPLFTEYFEKCCKSYGNDCIKNVFKLCFFVYRVIKLPLSGTHSEINTQINSIRVDKIIAY